VAASAFAPATWGPRELAVGRLVVVSDAVHVEPTSLPGATAPDAAGAVRGVTLRAASGPRWGSRRFVSLFWRLFIPNATVLVVAGVVLLIEPANGRILALGGGLAALLAVNLVLMRRAFASLVHLTGLMRRVDPLRPGQRIHVPGPESEVTLLAEAFNEMLDRLETERRESGRRALSERESERRLLAAELHDELGQRLTALALLLSRSLARAPGELRGELAAARDLVLRTVEDVRALARRLRPEALDALGLVPALTNLVERLSQSTGLPVERSWQRDLPRLDPDVELVVYRVAQESLTNVVRHARATRACVALGREDGEVVLTVSDDGVGLADANGGGSGVRGMRERALLVGGQLSLEASPGGRGTTVRLRVPLESST
jgi:two-component system sensor histidine kinase UhpB